MKWWLFITLSCPLIVHAQQLPGLTHAAHDLFLINPAAAGMDGKIVNFYYSNYFSGTNGAPQSQLVNFQTTIEDKHISIGASVQNDDFNILGRTGTSIAAAYQVKFRPSHWLSFGMAIEALHNRIYFDRIIATENPDITLLNRMDARVSWESHAGLLYRLFDFRFGIAAQQLFQNRLEYQLANENQLGYRLLRHYQLHGSWDKPLNENLDFSTTVILRTVQGLPTAFSIQTDLSFQDKLSAGVIYDYERAYGAILSVELADQYLLSYIAKQPANGLFDSFGASHEIRFSIRLNQQSNREIKQVAAENSTSIKVIMPDNSEMNKLRLAYDQVKFELEELKKDSWNEKPVEDKTRPYYVVTGTFSTARNARLYQKLFYRETGIKTDIIKENSRGFYLVYSDTVRTIKDGNKKIKKLMRGKGKGLMMDNPWLYKKRN